MGSGADRLEDRVTEWSDKQAGSFADHPKRTAAKWIGGIFAVIIVLGIVGGLVSWVGSWGSEAKRVVSPINVTEQFQGIIGDWQSAQQAADNACEAQGATKEEGDPVLVENPALAYAASFRNIVADYNARYLNIFRAKIAGPPGYPRPFPQELQPVGPKADWCSVSTQMRAYHN